LQCALEFKVITLNSVAGNKWERSPRGAGLGGASTHFTQTFEKYVFSRNLGQNMLENAIL